jgi:hypothetical protein
MVSHKKYNLNVNESFVSLLISKLITFFIDGFTSGMKSQSMTYLLGESAHIYIGFETLKMKCTQYGICSQAAFKNARAKFFVFGRGGQFFWAGLKNSWAGAEISRQGCPRPDLTPPIRS